MFSLLDTPRNYNQGLTYRNNLIWVRSYWSSFCNIGLTDRSQGRNNNFRKKSTKTYSLFDNRNNCHSRNRRSYNIFLSHHRKGTMIGKSERTPRCRNHPPFFCKSSDNPLCSQTRIWTGKFCLPARKTDDSGNRVSANTGRKRDNCP